MAKISISIKEGTVKKKTELIIGIDLGTTNSLVAYSVENVPKVIKVNNQSALMPSIIHFAEDGNILVGDTAKDKLLTSPERTIFSVKRLMGKSYNDIKRFSNYLAYEIVETNEEELVKLQIDGKFYTPIELSAKILESLKEKIQTELKQEFSKAVITVPAYFNDAQRQATRAAGKLAGLEVLRIVNEPTAACLAYGIGLDLEMEKTVAVYDLGGGTFDISILQLQNGVFEVLSTNGNTALGGDDLDRAIASHWQKLLSITDQDLQTNTLLAQQLRLKAEEAKIFLSENDDFTTELNGHTLKISKEEFNRLIHPLVEQTIESCKAAISDSELKITEIDEVLMVGGSTRTPFIKETVSKFFNREVNDSLNPDEVVALGAAVQADILAGNQKGILLLDITPLSLGIETMGGLMDVIIPRNNKVPTKENRQYTTSMDGQANLKISVYQGERDLVEHNRKLGEFILKGIPPMPAGLPKVDISFLIDADGILVVNANELRSGTETSLQIQSQYGISDEEMSRMLIDSIKNAKSDMEIRSILEAKNEGHEMIRTITKFLKDNRRYLTENEISTIQNFKSNLSSQIESGNKDKIHTLIKDINLFTEPLANEALSRIIKKEIDQ